MKIYSSQFFKLFSVLSNSNNVLSQYSTKKTLNKQIIESLKQFAAFENITDEEIEKLEKNIKLADKLLEVDTTNVKPLISTVYTRNLNLRKDNAVKQSNRDDLLALASSTEEFYYVSNSGIKNKQFKEDTPLKKVISKATG